jgi:putative transcriptional regulator
MSAKDKIPEFRFEDLLASMQQGADHAAGKITVRTHRLTARAAFMNGDEIASIRSKLNVSQAVFADLLNVPKATAIAWERGLRSPSGAAVRLLQIARENPEALIEATGRGH